MGMDAIISLPGLATTAITGTLTLTKSGSTARVATFLDLSGTVAYYEYAGTWTAAQTFSSDTVHRGVSGAPSVAFSSTQIRADGFRIINSSAAVDNRIWDTTVSGAALTQRSVNDAYGTAYTWLTVNRSGSNVTDIRFDATTGVGIGVTPTARLHVFSGAATALFIQPNNNVPAIDIYAATGGTANQRRMVMVPFVNPGLSRLEFQRVNDAGTYLGSALGLDMTGTAGVSCAANGLYLGSTVPTDSTAGNGLLQLASGTTKANGIAFGTDTGVYRAAAGVLVLDSLGTANDPVLSFRRASGATIDIFTTTGNGFIGTSSNHPLILRSNNIDRITITTTPNWLFGSMTAGTSAVSVVCLPNATAPTSSPAGGGQLYVESGALKYRGSSGTITTLGAA